MLTRNKTAEEIGLCASCAHMCEIRSDRGSTFYQCGLSASDQRLPKYPRLPVLSCAGYEEDTAENAKDAGQDK